MGKLIKKIVELFETTYICPICRKNYKIISESEILLKCGKCNQNIIILAKDEQNKYITKSIIEQQQHIFTVLLIITFLLIFILIILIYVYRNNFY